MISESLFAQRLKQARIDRDFTQELVAGVLGIPRTAVVQIEKGERSVSTFELAKLADLYQKSISSFFELDLAVAAGDTENDKVLAMLRSSSAVGDASITVTCGDRTVVVGNASLMAVDA